MSELPAQFSYVWIRFTSVKLPDFLRGNGIYDHDSRPPELARPLITLVGTLLALCVAVPVFVIYLIFGNAAAGVTGGLIAPLAIEFMTSWRGTNALAAYIIRRRAGATHEEAFELEPPPMTSSVPTVAVITIIVIWLIGAASFAALAVSGSLFWIIVSLTGGYMVRAEMASCGERGREFMYSPESHRYLLFYIWGVVMFFVSVGSIGALACACLAFAAAWGMAKYAVSIALSAYGGVNMNVLNIFGRAAELVLLLLGVFFFAGSWK